MAPRTRSDNQRRPVPADVRAVFTLPNAAEAFRSIQWEAVYSARGLKRLALIESATDPVENVVPLSTTDERKFKALKRALLSRLNGKRADLDWDEFDLDDAGDFHHRVWKAIATIPFGETATYAEVAGIAGSPLAFRACGQACGANRIMLFIPCHRVVASTGLGGFGHSLDLKKRLLALERPR